MVDQQRDLEVTDLGIGLHAIVQLIRAVLAALLGLAGHLVEGSFMVNQETLHDEDDQVATVL